MNIEPFFDWLKKFQGWWVRQTSDEPLPKRAELASHMRRELLFYMGNVTQQAIHAPSLEMFYYKYCEVKESCKLSFFSPSPQ